MSTSHTQENPYIATREMYGRQESYLDFKAFGAALAKALGASVTNSEPGCYGSCRLKLDDLTLYLGRSNKSGGKWIVHVGAGCPEIETRIHYSERGKFPSANVDSGRPTDVIAKDITRRVIEPGKVALAELKAKFAKQNSTNAELRAQAKALCEAFPGFQVNVENDQSSSAGIWGSNAGHYVTGTLYADGSISVQHIGTMDAERARRVLTALFAKVVP